VTALELVRRALTLVFVAVLALAGAGLLPLLAAIPLATAVTLALAAWIVRSHVTLRVAFDRQAWRALFAETLPYAIALSVAAVYFYVTVILMSLIASATQTGVFATSLRVTQAALAIPALLLTAIFPLMARARAGAESTESAPGGGPQSTPGAGVGKVVTVAAICGVWLSLALALGASFVIPLIAGHKADAAIGVLRIQSLVFVVSFVSTASALTLVALKRYRPLVFSSTGALLLNVVLGIVLIHADGARGGALADVLTETAAAIGLTLTVIRSVRGHEITARFVPPVLVAAGIAVAVLLLPIGSIAHVALATLIYFGVLLVLRAIPPEVTAALRSLRAR
jgi:O-antigen/teichoic acid export membrane protein